MDRVPVVVGNWKMQLSHGAALETFRTVKKLLRPLSPKTDVVIAASFPTLAALQKAAGRSSKIALAAQNIHWAERGAWTGEVAVSQITPFVSWCIIGHSEQRALTRETDEHVAAKAGLLLQHNITPVICLGETAQEKEAGQTAQQVTKQVKTILSVLEASMLKKVVIAYEPIWAISSNAPKELPEPEEMGSIMLLIRKLAAEKFTPEEADHLRVIYGGSVKANNVASYVSEPGVDGVLPGGASLHPREFVDIISGVEEILSAK